MFRLGISRAVRAVRTCSSRIPGGAGRRLQSQVPTSASKSALHPLLVSTATAALLAALSVTVGSVSASTDEEDQRESPTVKAHKLAYEHKIRTLSPTARQFRYFATIEYKGAIYMTPRDFIDSLVGGNLQPAHLQIDQFAKVEGEYRAADHMLPVNPEERALYKELENLLGRDVLISFSDYMFLLSMMKHSSRRFELAFKMFDRDGNGNLDKKEFGQVQSVTQHAAKASKILMVEATRSLFLERFFKKGNESLSFIEFHSFVVQLRDLVSKFEFERNSTRGQMSITSFVRLVIGNSGVNAAETEQYVERAEAKLSETWLSYSEYAMFQSLLNNLDDVNTAISLFSSADRDLTEGDLLRAATVAGVDASPKMIHVLTVLFDVDGDGTLSDKEFVKIMSQSAAKNRRSTTISFKRTFGGLLKCMKTLAAGDSID